MYGFVVYNQIKSSKYKLITIFAMTENFRCTSELFWKHLHINDTTLDKVKDVKTS